jgi:hypothetical protein
MKFKYKLVRSKRRTLAISITADNEVIVRAPMRTPLSYIEKFIDEKSGWVDKHLAKNAVINSVNDDVINHKKIYVCGNLLPLTIGEKDCIDESGVTVKNLSHLKKLFVATLGDGFLQLFNYISKVTNLKYSSVNFKDYKSRWGCCDGKNNIIFNYKLLMLPRRLWEYVIIHELCHTVQHNHSAKFWELVGEFLPDYKSRRTQMKRFAFVTRNY